MTPTIIDVGEVARATDDEQAAARAAGIAPPDRAQIEAIDREAEALLEERARIDARLRELADTKLGLRRLTYEEVQELAERDPRVELVVLREAHRTLKVFESLPRRGEKMRPRQYAPDVLRRWVEHGLVLAIPIDGR